MADSKAQSPPGGGGHQGAPEGPAPQSHDHTNGPGMTNGVPDAASSEEATGAPNSDRSQTETAGSPEPKDGHGS